MKFQEYIDIEETLQEARKKFTKKDFIEHFKPVWEQYPNLKAFRFNMYAPYFNDGAACIYSVNHDSYAIELRFESEWYNPDEQPDGVTEEGEFISKLAQKIPDDLYESVIGDGVEATFYPNKIEINEFEHD